MQGNNKYTLKFVEDLYKSIPDIKGFDIEKTLKERFEEFSKDYIEKITNISFNNSNKNIIKLENPKEIILKKFWIDELGFSFPKPYSFEPTYNYYKKDNQIVVCIECPGDTKLESNFEYMGEYTIIKLKGIKNVDQEPNKIEDNLFNSRVFGNFSLDILLKTEDYLLMNEPPKHKKEDGIIMLYYQLNDKGKNKIVIN